MPRLRSAFPWILASLAALGPACDNGDHPVRDCATVIWARAQGSGELRVQGSWDNWASPGRPLESYGDGWYLLELSLPPGEYGYLVVEGGEPRVDPYNPLTTFRGDEEVSLAMAPDCSAPELRVDAVEVSGADVTVRGTFLALPGGPPIEADTLGASLSSGATVTAAAADPETGTFSISVKGLPRGKHTLTLAAKDEDGIAASPARAVAWVDPAAPSWGEGILYQIVLDRFRGHGGAPLDPPASPGSRAGGTLDGVRAELEKGTFEALGVSGLWISPVYVNPVEIRAGRDGRPYEGYHGYWPVEPRGVDARIGGEEALRALMDAAHRRGIRVIFDLVPNHVYESSERYLKMRNKGWFNDGPAACVCGDPGCGWGDHIQTCWFTPYLPDVRWQHPDAMRTAVDDALWWMDSFDADGVRIDAVPMMPRITTRRITEALRAHAEPRGALFSVGEVYTGPGSAGIDTIRYYLGPYTLDGAFDFPLMWAIRDAVGAGRAGFDELETTFVQTGAAFSGSGAVIGRMINNHDTSRFISDATGGGWADPWLDPPLQPATWEAYDRARMALGLVLTLPGMPVLYYGDEVALAGAGDPDCRRVMPDLEAILPAQREVLDLTRRLGQLRRCSPALRAGERQLLAATEHLYGYLRDAGDGQPVVALFSIAEGPEEIALPAGAVPPGAYVDVVSGEPVEIAEGSPVAMEPLSFKVLVPADSPCLASLGDLP